MAKRNRATRSGKKTRIDPSPTATISRDTDSEVRERLGLILKDRSQAEVARCTGTSRANVNRYLRGTKIPGEFCSALVVSLGINPAWLLTGEGSVYLSDVTSSTAETASNLLDLVNAMNAVARMRLGALTGKEHRKVLRELNENLASYEKVRERLNEQTRAFFQQLLNDLNQAIDKRDFKAAERIRAAAEQVSRICNDRTLTNAFNNQCAVIDYHRGNSERALQWFRHAFRGMLLELDPAEFNTSLVTTANNYMSTLDNLGRVAEARRMSAATLALCGNTLELSTLGFFNACFEIKLGNIRQYGRRILTIYNRFPESQQQLHRGLIQLVKLMAGTTNFIEAMAADEAILKKSDLQDDSLSYLSRTMLRYACWRERQDELESACRIYGRGSGAQEGTVLAYGSTYARLLLKAMRSPTPGIFTEFSRHPHTLNYRPVTAPAKFELQVLPCQLARLVGKKEAAKKQLQVADKMLMETPPEIEHNLMIRAIHYRNALAMIPRKTRSNDQRELRNRAQDFFNDYYEKGYECFQEPATTP